ncbi:MAG: PIN domain-containing protein [Deltaproteobacteria bacterium]|nr:PIN domain-containing protein [Deltaproteobacteria bacterium]
MIASARPHLGLTFDTGALIALERRRDAMRKVFATAIKNHVVITVPVVVVTEWWRAGRREKERLGILRSVRVEALVEHVARVAGAALGRTPGAGAIDAIVVASAATRGDIVYTSDPDDLEALRDANEVFAAVRILGCG